MRPLRCFSIGRRAAWVQRKTPVRFVARTCCQSSSFMRRTRLSRVMPALFTRWSIRPWAFTTSSKAASTEARSATSIARASALPPAAVISATASARRARSRAVRTTVAPSAANALAIARPMPRDAPVTNETLPAREGMSGAWGRGRSPGGQGGGIVHVEGPRPFRDLPDQAGEHGPRTDLDERLHAFLHQALDRRLPEDGSRDLADQPVAGLVPGPHDPGLDVVDEGHLEVAERESRQVRRQASLGGPHERAVKGGGHGLGQGERSRGDQGRVLTQAVAGHPRGAQALRGQHPVGRHARGQDRRLGDGGELQLGLRALEAERRDRETQRLVGFPEGGPRFGERLRQGLAHAHPLRPLPGEDERQAHAPAASLRAPSARSSASMLSLTPLVKNSAAARIPFLMAWALDRPWPMTQQPFMPSRGAPPYSAGSIRCFMARKAPRDSQAPSFRRGVRVSSSFTASISISARVSLDFRATLPVKPSMTTTSTLPEKMSCPSTLPTKLRVDPFRTSWTSRVRSFPFVSSSPMLMRPTRGLAVWKTSRV